MKITIELTDEQLKEIFENAEVRFSKAKVKKMKSILEENELDVMETLETELMVALEGFVSDEWGE